MTTSPIHIKGLTKTFRHTTVLSGLTMTVEEGEVHGFLGPNGAGKSTTIRVLLGLLRADAGHVRVLDGNPWTDATVLHRRLAYVPGDVSLWPQLSGGEAIDLMMRLRGRVDQRRRDELIERFELDPTKKGRTYSKGNRQKVAIIAALASDVDLYILDEPTSGLDPLMEGVFQEALAEAKADGRTILLSSHILSEVEALCDRVSILRNGRIVSSGSLDDMRGLTRTHVSATVLTVPDGLDRHGGVHDLSVEGRKVEMLVDTTSLDEVMRLIAASGVEALTSNPPTLEELFLEHYSDRAA